MSNGPHGAADLPPEAERCPHYHRDANPTVPNANPNCRGRCSLNAGHPNPHGGRQDHATFQAASEYTDGYCHCDTCHLWVKDWLAV
jgi:hypothetical protein